MDSNERLHDMFNEIESMVSGNSDKAKPFLLEFFNLLFWKDYRGNYIDYDLKHELVSLYDYFVKHRSGGDEWYSFTDMEHVRNVISRVRKKIGLDGELPV